MAETGQTLVPPTSGGTLTDSPHHKHAHSVQKPAKKQSPGWWQDRERNAKALKNANESPLPGKENIEHWSVHDGKFFARNVFSDAPRAPVERLLIEASLAKPDRARRNRPGPSTDDELAKRPASATTAACDSLAARFVRSMRLIGASRGSEAGPVASTKGELAEKLEEHDTNAGRQSWTPALMGQGLRPAMLPDKVVQAALLGKRPVVNAWLAQGGLVDARDGKQRTVLILAAAARHEELTSDIVKAQASLDLKQEEGCTALALAAYCGSDAVVRILLKAGSDVDTQSAGGLTPLMFTVLKGHLQCATLLLAAGASLELRDHAGLSAMQHSEAQGHKGLAMLLRRARKQRQQGRK
jgi:hypothetical protein